jgi:basic membrane protein A
MGGIAVPAVVRFGIGYLAGIYYAADELGVDVTFPDDRYTYLGTFNPADTVKNEAAAWFNDGTEVIFASAGGAGSSVMSAAEDEEAMVIGVDVDQSSNSDTVLTSATKALAISVQDMLDRYYNDDFPGGETLTLDAGQDGVSLPMETSRFDTFTQNDYDAIYDMIADGTVLVPENYDALETFMSDNELGDLAVERTTAEPE